MTFALVTGLGCGNGASGTAHLQGQVTVDGRSLPSDAIGSITLQPTQKGQGPTVGAPIEGGKYDVQAAPLGTLLAYITVQQPTGRLIDNGRGNPSPEYENILSSEYSSGIEIQVSEDQTDLNFDLKGARSERS